MEKRQPASVNRPPEARRAPADALMRWDWSCLKSIRADERVTASPQVCFTLNDLSEDKSGKQIGPLKNLVGRLLVGGCNI